MKLTTPSPERVVNSLPPDLRASYEMNKKDRSVSIHSESFLKLFAPGSEVGLGVPQKREY